MSDLSLSPPRARSRRNLAIAGAVVLFHAAALWALQSGLLRRSVGVVVPVQVFSEIITPPAPKVEPAAPVKPPEPVPQPAAPRPVAPPPAPRRAPAPPPAPAPAPRLAPAAPLPPAPAAPSAAVDPQPAPPPVTAPVAVAAAPAPPPPLPRLELPSSSAEYLQNPKPVYPPTSKRLGEQGKVLVRVLIGVDGTALDAEIKQSSGYDRLDRAALETVRQWRYVPGKRAGVAQAMWFDVPIHYVLE